ncbi:MAG TPA: hypothetical protein VNQ99_07400 [Xanthobacteraceae bacterium]|nr:hypothetical protein [Xanthobacteraceae bacterium]
MTVHRHATAPGSADNVIASVAEAQTMTTRILQTMESLEQVVLQETEALRAGKLNEAMDLGSSKTEYSRRYMAEAMNIQANHGFLREQLPTLWQALQRRHESFRAVLQQNLMVLATSHAVSEGIVRGVSDALASKAAPTTYGGGGRPATYRTPAQPLAVSRVL